MKKKEVPTYLRMLSLKTKSVISEKKKMIELLSLPPLGSQRGDF
jgi:hypothetical protein